MFSVDEWARFISEDYQRRPAVMRAKSSNKTHHPFPLNQALETCARMLEAGVCDWKDHRAVRITEPRVPDNIRASLSDFSRFIGEVKHLNRTEQFTFSQHNCHQYLPDLKFGAREFLAPLFRRAGVPSNGVNIVLLGGHYKETPAGLHNDPADIFMFPLIGGKRLLTWPHELWDDGTGLEDGKIIHRRLPHIRWQDALSQAKIFVAEPGDVLYFPAGTWHINSYESIRDSLSLAITVFRNSDLRTRVLSIGRAAYAMAKGEERGNPNLQSLIGSFERAAKISQIQRQTAAGFVTGRQLNLTEIQAYRFVRIANRSMAANITSSECSYVIADGVAVALPAEPDMSALLDKLIGSGDTWQSIDEIGGGFCQRAGEWVRQLVAAGILEARQ